MPCLVQPLLPFCTQHTGIVHPSISTCTPRGIVPNTGFTKATATVPFYSSADLLTVPLHVNLPLSRG